MRIAIVQFPGSNCERETMLAVERADMKPIEFLWNESPEKLEHFAGYIIVGGFSYEDRSRAGAIAALDPIMEKIKEQARLGKPVLGICNGAQILVETGLVPGLESDKLGMALTENKRVRQGQVLGTGYYNAWVNLRLSNHYQRNAFTRHLTPEHILNVPVAHAEGRFIIPPALLMEIEEHGLNVFQYCDEQGKIVDEFPVNPNGSCKNIAAISNKAGNVLAIMPHPERTTNGDAIFHSMHDYIAANHFVQQTPLNYLPRHADIKNYATTGTELIVDLVITDNQAVSVQNALHHLGIPVTIKRQVHWEINGAQSDTINKIKTSGVLYNDRKEKVRTTAEVRQQTKHIFLVQQKENILGQEKLQLLQHHFDVKDIQTLKHGILWHIDSKDKDAAACVQQVIQSHILYNPYAYDCYYYR